MPAITTYSLTVAELQASRPDHAFGGLVWNRPGTRLLTDGSSDLNAALDQVERKLDNSLRTSATGLTEEINRAIDVAQKEGDRDARTDPDVLLKSWKLNKADWQYLDWDQAARLYMAAVAIENGERDWKGKARNLETINASSALYRTLSLRRGPEHFDSPLDFPRAEIRAEFRKNGSNSLGVP